MAVYYAAKENILTWPIGLINIITAFFIYYHVRLYSDMFLQIYFICISIYGWLIWNMEHRNAVPLKYLSNQGLALFAFLIIICTIVLGKFMSHIHEFFPSAFPEPAAYPYSDTLVAVASIIANTLMARRFIESWILWIGVDVICVYLYFQKDIKFIAFEFLIFLILACFGLYNWIQMKRKQDQISKSLHRL
ncbi:MAG: nicotinamide mononucleotide transporter [Saprospiraceae bacterium]|nr:nicotinamide mononucleotide transporter [Saprospiraceae bacterium]